MFQIKSINANKGTRSILVVIGVNSAFRFRFREFHSKIAQIRLLSSKRREIGKFLFAALIPTPTHLGGGHAILRFINSGAFNEDYCWKIHTFVEGGGFLKLTQKHSKSIFRLRKQIPPKDLFLICRFGMQYTLKLKQPVYLSCIANK